MKSLGVFVIMALVIGAFTSIPNVSAIGAYEGVELQTAKGTTHLTHGSFSGKVCGLELCNSKSMPTLTVEEKEVIVQTNAKNRALEKALEGSEASEIMASYLAYKNIELPMIEEEDEMIESESNFNAFANPDFLNSKAIPTLMKSDVEEEPYVVVLPEWIKDYSNPDHHQYVPKVVEIEEIEMDNSTSTLIKPTSIIGNNMTDIEADILLNSLGFEVDMSKVGVCGPGTELIDGFCLITEVGETANIDWADYWNTKEEEVEALEDVIMTDGTDTIPVIEDAEEEPVVEEIQEEEPVPVVEEVKSEVVLETMTVVVNGKTFKDQESADRYLELIGQGEQEPAPVEEQIEEPVQEESNPRIETEPVDDNNPPPFQEP